MDAVAKKKRVLIGNIFFSPTSFGGATVVAENMALELKNTHDWDVVVVANVDDPALPYYSMRRYSTLGIDVIGVKIPEHRINAADSWHNERFDEIFGQILDRVKPDVVHMHCVQNMGATCLEEVKSRKIPLVTTVHDCWWLCERQFMINSMGRYCHQETINPDVCRHCVDDLAITRRRTKILHSALKSSDLLLFPSNFHRNLHLLNGFPAEKCLVNKNGVKPPKTDFNRSKRPEYTGVRFGFVGGPGPIKGAMLIHKAFNEIEASNYELKVVDAGAARNETWKHDPTWKIPGKVTFVPPYTQESMDEFFSEIDVLLFPSQWKESFGLTVREAMIRGVWVIASDAGGLSEDCIDGVNATVIPLSSDHSYLKKAITNILDYELPIVRETRHISLIQDQGDQLNQTLMKLLDTKVSKRIEVPECQ
ncbi:glycosyltransferase family 4 protein [Microbulbifer hydrolyticus]|uniref:Glycosyltransferase n=1 Tax=Microbulbifer hydrolyticus TaxID=48074 RepID=A0A6P1TBC1_9GAMM|nr:glycosyltransferase family 4 protein [Microbulbifer hydrolyticus]MBB5210598.1 glycosyltransferase involved in cell wall biosynthesis [Microbulbifer hydrolyticus]QHQ38936.1 glycosyltransferase [Microbulbifer hydrolyticus]